MEEEVVVMEVERRKYFLPDYSYLTPSRILLRKYYSDIQGGRIKAVMMEVNPTPQHSPCPNHCRLYLSTISDNPYVRPCCSRRYLPERKRSLMYCAHCSPTRPDPGMRFPLPARDSSPPNGYLRFRLYFW